jgi:hypothetical protein
MRDFASYVVCAVGSFYPAPFVHFLSPNDAAGCARVRANSPGVERAYIFGVALTETGAAFNGVLCGDAELIGGAVRGTLQALEPVFS